MRIAVLGVGLIGGSVGLAARRRLGADVAGFDPDPDHSSGRSSSRRSIAAADSVAEAVAVRKWSSARRPSPRFPGSSRGGRGGGKPTPSSPTSVRPSATGGRAWPRPRRALHRRPSARGGGDAGVANARADLFEGARWYLTPTERRVASNTTVCSGRSPIWARGRRRSTPRRTTGSWRRSATSHTWSPTCSSAGGRGARRGVRAAAGGGTQLPRHDQGGRRQPGDLGRHLRRQPRGGRRARSTTSSG